MFQMSYRIYKTGWAQTQLGAFRRRILTCNQPAFSFDSILGIIFLQPVTRNRVNMGVNQQILDKFRGTGKGNLYRRVVLSTTKRASPETPVRELQEKREQSLQLNYWKPLVKRGALAQRYDGTEQAAQSIIRTILEVRLIPFAHLVISGMLNHGQGAFP